jgi:hypothetical protein
MIKILIFLLFISATGCPNGNGTDKIGTIDSNGTDKIGTIEGIVLDQNNYPLAGATVSITSVDDAVITDDNGQFSVDINEGSYTFEVFINGTSCSRDTIYCEGGKTTNATINTSHSLFDTITVQYIIVDDYEGVSSPGREWYYSRIGTNRGEMGYGDYSVELGGGNASAMVNDGWAGVWTSLKYLNNMNDDLDSAQILGPYIRGQYQPQIIGIEFELSSGSGVFKAEYTLANSVTLFYHKRFPLSILNILK